MKNLKAISEVVKRQVFTVAAILIGLSSSFAQGWEYNYGAPSTVYDRLYSGVEVNDGYVGAGYTTSPPGSYLIKVNPNGTMVWERKYGNYTTINSIRKTSDGGFILAGTRNNGTNNTEIKLIKTDGDGYQQWDRTYSGTFMNSGHYAEQTSDGGYVIACTRNRDLYDQYGTGDITLIKTDATGNVVWDENFGGNGYDAAASVTSTNDGGYAVVGTTINSVYANGTYVIKTNASGDTLWTKVFGQNYDSGVSIKEDDLGNLVLLNSNSFGPTIQLIKLSAVGDSLWTSDINGSSASGDFDFTSDGGFIVTGGNYNSDLAYLTKTDGSGNILWSQTFGGSLQDIGYDVQQTSDLGFVLFGRSYNYQSPGEEDAYIVKTNSQGTFSQLCSVDAGPDSIVCQSNVPLTAIPGQPGTYNFEWTPHYGVDNPYAQSTSAEGVHNQEYVVIMEDVNTGCVARDTVVVSSYVALHETYELCNGVTSFDMPSGFDSYSWNTGDTTRLLTVQDTGLYIGQSFSTECGVITHTFHVTECPCWVSGGYNVIGGNFCGDSIIFAATMGQQVQSWLWDFGDGTTSTASNPSHMFTSGTYQVTVTAVSVGGCTATEEYQIISDDGFEVSAGPDTIGCQTEVQLEANTSVPGIYTYLWMPSTGLSNPNIENPIVSHANNETYVIYAVDNNTGCDAYDTVSVSAYNPVFGTHYLCVGTDTLEIDLGPGADYYQWFDGDTSQIREITEAGGYYAVSQFPQCGSLTSSINVIDSCLPACSIEATVEAQSCEGPFHLFGTPDNFSSNYIYEWSPSTNLTDHLSNDPWAHNLTNETLYTVYLIDTVTGCTASDSVLVSPHFPNLDDYYLCGDSVLLDLGADANHYQWQIWVDTNGTSHPISDTNRILVTDDLGTYLGVAFYDDCGTVTSEVHVYECPSNCFNIFTYTPYSSSACGDSIWFVGTAGNQVVSWHWDFGDGHTSNSNDPYHYFTEGIYQVTLTTVDINGCTATSSETLSFTNGFSVDAGPDTTTCQSVAQLYATPSVPSNYQFEWSPSTGLDYNYIQNPTASGVHEQVYTVTAIDILTGCEASDSVMVSAYTVLFDTFDLCPNGFAELDFGPGGEHYFWQYYTDESGNSFALFDSTQTILVDDPGQYFGYAVFPGCGALTSLFTVIETCSDSVWPGDANSDGVANNLDILTLGIGYFSNGPVRPGANILWEAQAATDWLDTLQSGVNYKHIDCNGDGVVNMDDTLAVVQNYGYTHNKAPNEGAGGPNDPLLYITINEDSVLVDSEVHATIHLGTMNIQAENVYGLAFTINYNAALIDTSTIQMDFNNSWMGTRDQNMIAVRKVLGHQNKLDVAKTRIDHTNVSGYGPIANLGFITIDNLSGKMESTSELLHLTISDVKLIDRFENEIPVNTGIDSVVITDNSVGVEENEIEELSVYPNPATNEVIVQYGNDIESIKLYDARGRILLSEAPNKAQVNLDISHLDQGIYHLEMQSGAEIITDKLTIIDK